MTHDSTNPENHGDLESGQDEEFISALKALPLETPSSSLDDRIAKTLASSDVIGDIESGLKRSLTGYSASQSFWQLNAFKNFAMGAAACLILAIGISRFHQAQLDIRMSHAEAALAQQAEDFRQSKLAYERAQEKSYIVRPDDTVNARFVGTIQQPNGAKAADAQSILQILKQSQENARQQAGNNIAWHSNNKGVQELHLKITRQYDRLIIHDANGGVIYNGPIMKKK